VTQNLTTQFMHLMWLANVRRARAFRGRGPLADTTRGQGRLLAALKLKDGIPTKDLAAVLGMSTASLNELIGKMVRAGYVTREQSPEDGRVMLVTLTDAGRAVEQGRTPDDSEIFDCLSDDEQATLSDYLDRIITSLSERMGIDAERDGFARAMEERMRLFEEMGAFDRRRGGRGRGGFGGGPRGFGGGPRGFDGGPGGGVRFPDER
jgi:DNA-binding MarR family transcriptional regulator